MDIQKAIDTLSAAANSSASKNWNYTPYVKAVLAHITELQQSAEKAETQLAEQQSITRRVAAESNALHDERNKLRAQVADLEESLNSCLITVARYSGPDVAPPAPFVVKNFPARKSPSDYVDESFSNRDLAAIWNACRLACKVKIQDAGGSVADE